jgi:hypothetical protein
MSVMGFAKLDYQHGRIAELPWPVIAPTSWLGVEETAGWALRELVRMGIEIPPHLRRPAAQVIAYVYEAGYDDG